ncbi:type I restriction-modification system subunit M [Halobaculum lipolyticum]|uniref:site-specific DNA-methyltransferase (adenine-specific) n=1 Tax=Halobaculum lipolyticum TaxID=3032001 RepID=A0ABD5WB35_9EURY|nr:class I SAM-dependent DNA methyltransferase [Halobaculum sp. DT31]
MGDDEEDVAETLFSCFDILRGTISPVRYKEYVVPLIYYKRVSDESNRASSTDKADATDAESLFSLPYLEEQYRWEVVTKQANDLGDDLNEAIRAIPSHESVEILIKKVDFTELSVNGVLEQIVENLDEVTLDCRTHPSAQFGPCFDSLLTHLFNLEGRRGSEFTTPRTVARLATELVDELPRFAAIHDPTVGTGGFLAQAAKHDKDGAENQVVERRFTGQDLNPLAAGIARINLEMHGVESEIKVGDSLVDPGFTTEGELERFDLVFSDFPISMNWENTRVEEDPYDRFPGLEVPDKRRADYAFILHALSCLKTPQQDEAGGQAALVVPIGVLYRESERQYRKYLIENDYVEQIIHLPEDLYQQHSLATAILVLNTAKPPERHGEVRFVDAGSEEFYDETGDHRTISVGGVNKANKIGNAWEKNGKVARTVPHERIEASNFSLNISKYLPASDDPSKYRFSGDTEANSNDGENDTQSTDSDSYSFDQHLSDLITASENSVYVLGKYGGATEAELLDVRNELREIGYDAYVDRDLADFPTQDLSGSVTTTMRLVKFCIMVDREASGHLNEYQLAQLNRTVLARLTPEDGGSTRMIGAAENIDVNYIKKFEFDLRPQERLSEAVDWAEEMISRRRREYNELYDWREE